MLTVSSLAEIAHAKKHLHSCFGTKDLKRLHYLLGLEVSYIPQGIVLSQKKFTLEFLEDSQLPSSKPTLTPPPPNCKLSPKEGELLTDPTYYRAMVGKLNFLTHTRPDFSFATETLSQFM